MKESNEEKVIKQIQESLDSLDNMQVETPHLNHFRQLVEQVEEKKRCKLQRSTLSFVLCAITLLSTETFAFYKSMMIFFITQVVAITLMVGILVIHTKQESKREDAI